MYACSVKLSSYKITRSERLGSWILCQGNLLQYIVGDHWEIIFKCINNMATEPPLVLIIIPWWYYCWNSAILWKMSCLCRNIENWKLEASLWTSVFPIIRAATNLLILSLQVDGSRRNEQTIYLDILLYITSNVWYFI